MGIGLLQPMHLFIILLTILTITAALIGGALLLVRYAVRYNRQLEQQSRSDSARG